MTLTLNDLVEAWSPHVATPDYVFDNATAERWIIDDDIKAMMRLACDLGLAEDARGAERLLGETGIQARLLKEALASPERLSAATRASIEKFGDSGRHLKIVDRQAFVVTGLHDAQDAILVHFTHDPQLVLTTGFRGTVDPADLSSTFMMPKGDGGLNFAFMGGSFDAKNFATDGFYGCDAVLFRTRHLATLNLESQDHEIIFEGASFDVTTMIHLREDDGIWSVLATDGEALFQDRSLNACVAWVTVHELSMAERLTGARCYEMRLSEEMFEQAARTPAPIASYALAP